MTYQDLTSLLKEGVREEIFPGAVGILADPQKVLWHAAIGCRMIVPEKRPMELDTLFDLASLTKVVATTTLAMQCVEQGSLSLDMEVSSVLPAFDRSGICVHHLLTHTSGLPAWKPLYLDPGKPEEIIAHLGDLTLAYSTGSKVEYSCLGYILLGKVIEIVCGDTLDTLARKQIFDPLGMQQTCYNPPVKWADRCAATEDSNSFEKRKVHYQRYDWRDEVILGEVHDENAHFLGGVSGNAGLFSTATDLMRFGQMFLTGGGGILTRDSIQQMAQLQTPGLNERRGLGWILMADGSLYHTGFTGTAMRMDLKRQRVAVLLTNRVHPDASREGIVAFRSRFFSDATRWNGK